MSSLTRYTPLTREQKLAASNSRNWSTAKAVRDGPKSRAISGGGTAGARPKTEPKRNRALLDMAKGRSCLLQVLEACNRDPATTVAAHSNLGAHGKSKGRKADDCYSVQACSGCHAWLDQGPATKAAKEAAFMAAHLAQVLEWRRIAADPSEPERFRKAAQWALDQLGASPVGETA